MWWGDFFKYADNLQDRIILHFVTEMEREMNESLQFQDDFYKPQTIAAKLNAVAKFIRFTRQRKIFFGLTFEETTVFLSSIGTHCKGLSIDIQ